MDTNGTESSVRITWITEAVRASELEHGGSWVRFLPGVGTFFWAFLYKYTVMGLYAGGRPNFEQVPAAMLAIRVPVAQWLERPN